MALPLLYSLLSEKLLSLFLMIFLCLYLYFPNLVPSVYSKDSIYSGDLEIYPYLRLQQTCPFTLTNF